MKTRISYLPRGERDNEPQGIDLEWLELATILGSQGIDAAACTLDTCGAGDNRLVIKGVPKDGACRLKYGRAWTPAVYPPGANRANRNVGVVSLLVVDLDHLDDLELIEAFGLLEGLRYIAHPSHSDGLPKPPPSDPTAPPRADRCWRVVIALSEPVLAADWPRFWTAAMARLGLAADPSCCDAARLYFLPSRRADAPDGQVEVREGAPLDVRAALASAPPPIEQTSALDAGDLPPASPELLERCRARLLAHGPAVEGRGGDRWTFSACAALVHGYGLAQREAWPLLVEWNATCEPPWELDELRTKLDNAGSYASGPRGSERLEWEASERLRLALVRPAPPTAEPSSSVELDWGLPDEPSPDQPAAPRDAYPADVLDVLRRAMAGEVEAPPEDEPGFTGALSRARREVAAAFGAGGDQNPHHSAPLFTPMMELLKQPQVATPWLVRGLLKEGGVAMPAAGPKAGKTFVALELACAVATGTRAFGTDRFKVPRARSVAYFFAEDDHASLVAHMTAYASGRGVPVADLARNFYARPMGQHIDLTRDEDLAYILASCREILSLGLLVMDPLRDVHTGEENSNDGMARVLSRLRFLSRELGGITVMVPHHTSKITKEDLIGGAVLSGGKIRGASAIYGALDSLILLARDEAVDDEGKIALALKSIIKGARSGGTFGATLTIIDNDEGQSKHAEWAYVSGADKRGEEATDAVGEAVAADLAVALIEHMRLVDARKEAPHNVEKLRAALKWGSAKFNAAIAHASAKLWIERPKQKWELTALGRTLDVGLK